MNSFEFLIHKYNKDFIINKIECTRVHLLNIFFYSWILVEAPTCKIILFDASTKITPNTNNYDKNCNLINNIVLWSWNVKISVFFEFKTVSEIKYTL